MKLRQQLGLKKGFLRKTLAGFEIQNGDTKQRKGLLSNLISLTICFK